MLDQTLHVMLSLLKTVLPYTREMLYVGTEICSMETLIFNFSLLD